MFVFQINFQANKVQCQQISVGHGQEEVIDVALATAVRTDTWLVIENLQLASRPWLEQLYNRLSRLQLQAGTCYIRMRSCSIFYDQLRSIAIVRSYGTNVLRSKVHTIIVHIRPIPLSSKYAGRIDHAFALVHNSL